MNDSLLTWETKKVRSQAPANSSQDMPVLTQSNRQQNLSAYLTEILTTIMGYSDMLMLHVDAGDREGELVRRIRAATERAAEICRFMTLNR